MEKAQEQINDGILMAIRSIDKRIERIEWLIENLYDEKFEESGVEPWKI